MPACILSYVNSEICKKVKTLNPGDVIKITLESDPEVEINVTVVSVKEAYLTVVECQDICCLSIKTLEIVSRHVSVGLENFESEPE